MKNGQSAWQQGDDKFQISLPIFVDRFHTDRSPLPRGVNEPVRFNVYGCMPFAVDPKNQDITGASPGRVDPEPLQAIVLLRCGPGDFDTVTTVNVPDESATIETVDLLAAVAIGQPDQVQGEVAYPCPQFHSRRGEGAMAAGVIQPDSESHSEAGEEK